MGFIDKIEEIRNKPESVRMRYVWISVIISMIIVIIIWFFSMRELFSSTKSDGKVFEDLKKSFEKANEQLPSINDMPLPSAEQKTSPSETPRENTPENNEGFQENSRASFENSAAPKNETPSEVQNNSQKQLEETPAQ